MSTLHDHRWFRHSSLFALLAGAAIAPTLAATSALQPAAPSVLQQAQPAFGERVEPVDPKNAASKKPEPFGLKPAPGPGIKAAPGLPPTDASVNPLTGPKTSARSGKKLFDMEDRAIIIVGGKQTTAGELKRSLLADIARKAGPPRTVKGGARKLDLAALNVTTGSSGVAPLGQKTATAQAGNRAAQFALAPKSPPTLSTYSQTAPTLAINAQIGKPAPLDPSTQVTAVGKPAKSAVLDDFNCVDHGPPRIIQVAGTLRPGRHVAVVGRCFGDRPGRVELIGQFSGGKLTLPFMAWDKTGIDVEVPATIRGAGDHAVALTVVTVDGKSSPAMQAKFVAAQERVEVPERLWSPSAGFEMASTRDDSRDESGQVSKSLRVNPQCVLHNFDATILSGDISQMRGWEQGRANETSITFNWIATCLRTTTTTSYSYFIVQRGDDYSVSNACRVAFLARAWAYCPVGVAP